MKDESGKEESEVSASNKRITISNFRFYNDIRADVHIGNTW